MQRHMQRRGTACPPTLSPDRPTCWMLLNCPLRAASSRPCAADVGTAPATSRMVLGSTGLPRNRTALWVREGKGGQVGGWDGREGSAGLECRRAAAVTGLPASRTPRTHSEVQRSKATVHHDPCTPAAW